MNDGKGRQVREKRGRNRHTDEVLTPGLVLESFLGVLGQQHDLVPHSALAQLVSVPLNRQLRTYVRVAGGGETNEGMSWRQMRGPAG